MRPRPAVIVLGIGNPIMGDDGVGLELLASTRAARPDPRIEYIDGGTGGMELLPEIEDAERLLVLDAVAGTEPGTVVRLSGEHLPRLLAGAISPHQVGLRDVLAAARLLGREPRAVEVVGVVPGAIELRLGLTSQVSRSVTVARAEACAVIDGWLAA
ncbi:MAG: hydrogenase maturation protease [Bifidobacteriaceae bacterium]|jgi:hydrogenase maturation protease|nr:hydrogenase maturation protease [Bifidobacteriaceae bacterium]